MIAEYFLATKFPLSARRISRNLETSLLLGRSANNVFRGSQLGTDLATSP